jgi:hypothetical protein
MRYERQQPSDEVDEILGRPRPPAGEPDDTEPTRERQAELRAAYEANVAAGKAPYEGVRIRTLGELRWIMSTRGWTGEATDAEEGRRVDLTGASLRQAVLTGQQLNGANLTRAHLDRAVLRNGSLRATTLHRAHLDVADLRGTNLRFAHMDAMTDLRLATFDSSTLLADVAWNDVPLTLVDWNTVPYLGDESGARRRRDEAGKRKSGPRRLGEYERAVRANRQLAVALRNQGINEHADRYAYRAQLCQRVVLRRQRHYLRYLGSLFLWFIAGYGYRPLRSVLSYMLVVTTFAAMYFALGGTHGQALTWNEALVVSLTAFHGRGFFATAFQPGDPQAVVAAIEAVVGLLIEITFIATFTNRFFAR